MSKLEMIEKNSYNMFFLFTLALFFNQWSRTRVVQDADPEITMSYPSLYEWGVEKTSPERSFEV